MSIVWLFVVVVGRGIIVLFFIRCLDVVSVFTVVGVRVDNEIIWFFWVIRVEVLKNVFFK